MMQVVGTVLLLLPMAIVVGAILYLRGRGGDA